MRGDLRQLYQEVIVDHTRHPRNFSVLPTANHTAEGFNPLCGDRMTLYIEVENNVIKHITFQGAGCSISTASCSLMTEHLKGKTLEEAQHLFDCFHEAVTASSKQETENPALGKLNVLSGVQEFPARVKCATLAWHTLKAALEKNKKAVSTE